ncbi:MAG: Hsp20/alpha crystallin family protein [Haloglomus sp.]
MTDTSDPSDESESADGPSDRDDAENSASPASERREARPPGHDNRRERRLDDRTRRDTPSAWTAEPGAGRAGRSPPGTEEESLPRWGLQAHPDVDVAEHPDELHVWCDLPGCAEETIELSGDEWTLYVSAERAEAHWEEGGIQRRERSRHAERSVSLPARADIDAAEASFDDGVLFVRVPKHASERTQPIGFE